MFDTPQYDWGNDHDPATVDADSSQDDGILDTGDGWYGEDVGADGLYAELPPGIDSVERDLLSRARASSSSPAGTRARTRANATA